MIPVTVLDASALIAVIFREPGSAVVEAVLRRAAMSAVNLCEVVTKLLERGYSHDEAEASVMLFQLAVHDFDLEQAFAASALRPITRSRGLSFGDRACLALAQTLDATVLTADRAWAGLEHVELIR